MGKSHLSALAAPKSWPIERKKYGKWIVRPSPGAHSIFKCLPISVVLRETLRCAKSAREARKILNDENIFVDGMLRKKHNFPVGLMDIFRIKFTNECFRVVVGEKGRLKLVLVKDGDVKLLKVIGKTAVGKNRMQVNFHDGKNILTDRFEGSVGDSIVYDLNGRKIIKSLGLAKGNLVLIDGGRYVGIVVRVKDIIKGDALKKSLIVFEKDGKDYTTLKDYAFVVGTKSLEVEMGVKI